MFVYYIIIEHMFVGDILERTILHCDLNNFYASVECRNDPSLKGKPVAVCGNTEERHGIVLAKSEEAKRFGIKTGQPLWEAKQLCPELIAVPPHMKEYVKISKQVRSIYDKYSDLIEPFGIDECFVDITGMDWMYGSGQDFAEKLRNEVKDTIGLTISIGVSFNKIFAKLGSDMKKPDAVTCISRGDFKEKVWPLPARDLLFIGPATERKLLRYGIHTIGDVSIAGPEFLQKLLGKNGLVLWLNASGLNSDPVMPGEWSPEIKSIGHGITCTADLVDNNEVYQTIYFLAQDVSYRLRKNCLFATGVQIDVKDRDRITQSYQGSLPLCTQNSKIISQSAYELFTHRYDWHLPVRAVTVRAISLFGECLPIQTDMFFDMKRYDKSNGAEKAAMAVQEKFGRWTIRPASMMTAPKLPSNAFDNKSVLPSAVINMLKLEA